MYRNRWRCRVLIPAVVLAGVMLAGCGPHRDVMVFGTNTKVALDVSPSPAGGTFDFTFGFKRQEMVYMPLLVNANDSKLTPNVGNNGPDIEKVKYTGTAGSNGAEGKDTYSVFASFGGEFSGGPSGGSAGLAQFFATGIAAQRLGNNAEAVKALRVQPANAELVDQLKSQNEQLADFYGLTPEQVAEAIRTGRMAQEQNENQIEEILSYVNDGAVKRSDALDEGDIDRLRELLEDVPLKDIDDSNKEALLSAQNFRDLEKILAESPPLIMELYSQMESSKVNNG